MKRALSLALPTLVLGGLVTLPLPSLNGCSMLAWAAETRTYGTDGEPGRNGRDGLDGRAGQSTNTVANGTSASFSLIGEDGGNGEDGDNGEPSRCDRQVRNVAYNLQAADGGDGGQGGRGGHGGNGGDLTVYYQDRAALQRLSVTAQGGRGGRGGRGGYGTVGCRCSVRSWELQTCTGTPGQPNYSCRTNRYECRDGRYGTNGNVGPDGQNGQDGQLWLVNQLEPLQPENPAQTVRLPELASQPLPLSRNLWTTRTGANGLLAPGSRVNDSYREYTGRLEGSVALNWQAPRPLSLFATETITAEIREDGTLGAAFSDGLWAEYTPQQSANQMAITVTNAVRSQDVTRLAWGGLQGNGPSLKAIVLDLAGESAYLQTQFRVTLKTTTDDPRESRRPRYTTVYDEVISPALVTLNNNRFELALGQLPIEARALRQGTYAQLEITAIRSLGENSAQQDLSWRGQF